MAITLFQSNAALTGSGTSLNCVFSSNVTANNIFVVGCNTAAGATVTMSDNRNGTYSAPAVTLTSAVNLTQLYVVLNTFTGSCTVNMALASASSMQVGIMEFTGLIASPVDQTASAHQTTTTTPSVGPTPTTTAAIEAVVACFGSNGSKTWSAGGSYTAVPNVPLTGNIFIEYLLTSTTGAQTATCNMTSGQATNVLVTLIGNVATAVPPWTLYGLQPTLAQ